MTLLILAAGMGSRFGGLKQMEPMGPNGEFIIDYSVYDALKVGFNKIVFIIREEMYNDFKETIGKRIPEDVNVSYVFQKDTIFNRKKPLGTAHAIYCAKEEVNEPFAIINADDFYGRDAFKVAINFLNNNKEEDTFGLVAYRAINTLSEKGSVKRGIIKTKDNYLDRIIESKIELKGEVISAQALVDGREFTTEKDSLVSMNMILFTPKIFDYLKSDLDLFIKNIKDEENEEFLIPEVIDKHIKTGDIKVRVLNTSSKWYGITYKDDKEDVTKSINNMIDNGEYKNKLWN